MIINGLLISKDKEHAVIRQNMTGYNYVVRLKNLQIEKHNGEVVMYNKKPSVRIVDYPFVKCECATEIKKISNVLAWKSVSNSSFHCELD